MNFIALSDVPLEAFRSFLQEQGYKFGCIPCGHEKWCKEGKLRPIVLRICADPVPAYIVLNALRAMDVAVGELRHFLEAWQWRIKQGPEIPALA